MNRQVVIWLTAASLWMLGAASGVVRAQEEPTIVLGRLGDRSVTINALGEGGELYFEYGAVSGDYTASTAVVQLGEAPVEVVAGGLAPNTRYYYRARHRIGPEDEYSAGVEHSFHTQRPRGEAFTFTVQADSHQGFAFFHNPELYRVMFGNVLADRPDFHIDLGDAFSLDDNSETVETVREKYLSQRQEFALVGHSAAIMLVLGNHENEEGWNLDDTLDVADSLPVLGANARKRYFANPIPDGFYSGNEDASLLAIDGDHLKENYYAFEWGDALFVAIDPFWNTMTKPFAGGLGGEQTDETVGDRWDWTLGEAQYEWLRTTLEQSDARFKFVFAHHLVGGTADYSRGGAVGAQYCEWGGYNVDGETWGFDIERPSFVMPIHDMLVANGVTIFFHGHDHVFVMEELDGIVYQECPHAANDDYGTGFGSNVGDYVGSTLVNNSGHLRVDVSPDEVTVRYVRAFLPGAGENGEVEVEYGMYAPADNSPPTAADDEAATVANAALVVDVLANDEDADGDQLSVVGVSQPSHGSAINLEGDVYYEPDTDYCDDDETDVFRYAMKDGRGGSRTATVRVTVSCAGIIAEDDHAETLRELPLVLDVLANDSEVQGMFDRESLTPLTQPVAGSLALSDGASFTYTPSAGFVGSDGFDYQVCDLDGRCASARVTVSVVDCFDAADCDDGDACTVASCEAGSCASEHLSCVDHVACTVDSCDSGEGCVNAPDHEACDDLDPCTIDVCTESGCDHVPFECDDGDPCTSDACIDGACRFTTLDCGVSDACDPDACGEPDPDPDPDPDPEPEPEDAGHDSGAIDPTDQPDAGAQPDAAADAGTGVVVNSVGASDAEVAGEQTPDAGSDDVSSSGCGCRTVSRGSAPPGLAGWLVILALLARLGRRRRRLATDRACSMPRRRR